MTTEEWKTKLGDNCQIDYNSKWHQSNWRYIQTGNTAKDGDTVKLATLSVKLYLTQAESQRRRLSEASQVIFIDNLYEP